MKIVNFGTLHRSGLVALILAGSISVRAGDCALGQGSTSPSKDGCTLAFMYNQKGDHRLVVIDERNRQRYEAPLETARMAPFWEGGKVYVVAVSGVVQGFSIGPDKLVPEKEERIAAEVVRDSDYDGSRHRLYLIRTIFDDRHREFFCELSAIDFPSRKTLWTKKLDDPGLLSIMDGKVYVSGLRLLQAFNGDTGKKIGTIAVGKSKTSADAGAQK